MKCKWVAYSVEFEVLTVINTLKSSLAIWGQVELKSTFGRPDLSPRGF
jgi:hypothetical protein